MRRTWLITLVPVAAYLLILLGLALFVVHPPFLGWLGLAVVAAISLSLWALAVWLLPRSRVNVDRLHPHPGVGDVFRLLVVLDADVEPDELARAVTTRTVGRRSDVHVVAPAVGRPLHLVTSDAEVDRSAAERRLAHAVPALTDAGVETKADIGPADPLEATADALNAFPVDEILFVGRLTAGRDWPDHDYERRARDLFGVHCSTVYGR